MDLNKIKKFYKNKKVFITGHTGFKGVWIFLILKFLGAKVKGYSLPLNKNDNFHFFKKIKKKYNKESIYGDVLDFKNLNKSINKFKPQIVFHFAAQSLVIESQKFPVKTLEVNVLGTYNIISSCFKNKSIKSLVIATSDKCYLNVGKSKKFYENSELGGVEPYSSSKAMCEQLINFYHSTINYKKNFSISSVRAGNVIGGGDFSEYRILPDIIRNYKKRKIILRNPNHIRPWQHVLDVCLAYILIPIFHYKNKKKYSGPYNVGPSQKIKLNVLNLTKLFIKNLGYEFKIVKKKTKFIESKQIFLEIQKIKKFLNWKPLMNYQLSIKLTADWYKNYLKKKDIVKTTFYQINNYFNSL